MWLSSVRGSLIKASVKQGAADKPGSAQRLIAPFPGKEAQPFRKEVWFPSREGGRCHRGGGCDVLLFGLVGPRVGVHVTRLAPAKGQPGWGRP